jgi:hypothetical protein
MKRIRTKKELVELARELGVRPDWHEPDEQGVSAVVYGQSFDNAGFWDDQRSAGLMHEEMYVILYVGGSPAASVNLATLFAWATGLEG